MAASSRACRHSCAPPHADRSPLSTRSASDYADGPSYPTVPYGTLSYNRCNVTSMKAPPLDVTCSQSWHYVPVLELRPEVNVGNVEMELIEEEA